MAHDFNWAILDQVAHRPWKMPDRPWVLTQSWNDLLFAHWQVDAASLRAHVPAAFELDLYNGTAWLAIVPFYMTNVAPRGVPTLPRLSEFAELNVRTYVRVGDRPGIYFFSLDAASTLAVWSARMLFNLPYFTANMSALQTPGGLDYRSARTSDSRAAFRALYAPVGAPFEPAPGSLEYFLSERYCLYHLDHGGRPYHLEIHHPPWSLQVADAQVTRNTMAEVTGLSLSGQPQLLHFAKRQDAVAWLPSRLA